MRELEALREKRLDKEKLTSPTESKMNSKTVKENGDDRKNNEKCLEIDGNPIETPKIDKTQYIKRENISKKHACSKLSSKNEKISPKKDETRVGINPIEGIADMDAHLRSQMTFVFFCCSSFVMLIVYIGECKNLSSV